MRFDPTTADNIERCVPLDHLGTLSVDLFTRFNSQQFIDKTAKVYPRQENYSRLLSSIHPVRSYFAWTLVEQVDRNDTTTPNKI